MTSSEEEVGGLIDSLTIQIGQGRIGHLRRADFLSLLSDPAADHSKLRQLQARPSLFADSTCCAHSA